MSWQDRAACKGLTDLFAIPEFAIRRHNRRYSPANKARIAQAKAICHECPVLADCTDWYRQHPDYWMIAAAQTPDERNNRTRGVA